MIAVVDYAAGNVRSVTDALGRCGVGEWTLTAEPAVLAAADKVILPGVGDASVAIRSLREGGLDGVLRSLTRPLLGICVGMQLLCSRTEEGGEEGLGIFDAAVVRLTRTSPEMKIPHTGWDAAAGLKGPLFAGLPDGSWFYFVHSYIAPVCADTVAVTDYGGHFSAALAHDNFYGTQFHPEKSGAAGTSVLKNFLAL